MTYPFATVQVGGIIIRVWRDTAFSDIAALVANLVPGTLVSLYSDKDADWTYIVPKKPRRRFKCT